MAPRSWCPADLTSVELDGDLVVIEANRPVLGLLEFGEGIECELTQLRRDAEIAQGAGPGPLGGTSVGGARARALPLTVATGEGPPAYRTGSGGAMVVSKALTHGGAIKLRTAPVNVFLKTRQVRSVRRTRVRVAQTKSRLDNQAPYTGSCASSCRRPCPARPGALGSCGRDGDQTPARKSV